MNRFWSLLVLMSAIIIVDQLLKGFVQSNFPLGTEDDFLRSGFFGLTYQKNSASFFGWFSNLTGWFWTAYYVLIPFIFILWLFKLLIKNISHSFFLCLGISFLIAGTSSNLFDRYFLKYILENFYFRFSHHHLLSFNLAEIVFLFGIFLITYSKCKKFFFIKR